MISWIIQSLLWCKEAFCYLFTEKYFCFKILLILYDIFCFAYIIIVIFVENYIKQFSYFIIFKNLDLCLSCCYWWLTKSLLKVPRWEFFFGNFLQLLKVNELKCYMPKKFVKLLVNALFLKISADSFNEVDFVSPDSLLDVFLFWSFYRNSYDLLDALSSWPQMVVQ